MRPAKMFVLSLALLSIGVDDSAESAKAPSVRATFTTLGTNSGPIPNPRRAEPANLLRVGGQNILVDVGDGASWQLAKAGVRLEDVQTIIISHLHFDHTGGLFAFISQRYQGLSSAPVAIYGPPGTQKLVDALLDGIVASTQGPMYGRARLQGSPRDNIKVVEIGDGATFALGDVQVTSASNTHYSIPATSPDAVKYVSLSYRFDTPGRSIVFTGDTGPSPNVEKLAKGADVLFCEIMDPDAALAKLKVEHPDILEPLWNMVSQHFHHEHMSPTEVGLLAGRAGVKALVLTHIALVAADIPKAKASIAVNYKGKITFAEDLNAF